MALGEELFPVRSIPGSSSPSVALGEGFPECFLLFPECFRHSGKQVAAVVRDRAIIVIRWNIIKCQNSITSYQTCKTINASFSFCK
jgi:hypothetical protein